MATTSTMERTERLTLADMVVVDADVHVNDPPGALAPYCDLLAAVARGIAWGIVSLSPVPGFAPNMRLDPPIQGSHAYRSVDTAAAMRAELSELEIDIGILFPDHMLTFAALPNIEYATALAQAYNRWLMEEWLLKEPGLYGVMLASRRTRRRRRERSSATPKRSASSASTCRPQESTPWGHRIYDPIMAAADATGLPVCLHSVTLVSPAFPCQLDQFENHFGRQVLSHAR